MGTTTFTGPVRSGPIFDTSGNTLGNDVANVGYAVLAQSFPLLEDGLTTDTTIVLPAGATIVSIQVVSTVAWGAALDLNVVDYTGAVAALAGTQTPTLGVQAFTPSALAEAALWIAAPTDLQVQTVSTAAGAGDGVLTVTYIQN